MIRYHPGGDVVNGRIQNHFMRSWSHTSKSNPKNFSFSWCLESVRASNLWKNCQNKNEYIIKCYSILNPEPLAHPLPSSTKAPCFFPGSSFLVPALLLYQLQSSHERAALLRPAIFHGQKFVQIDHLLPLGSWNQLNHLDPQAFTNSATSVLAKTFGPASSMWMRFSVLGILLYISDTWE